MSKLWTPPDERIIPVHCIRHFGEPWARDTPAPFGNPNKPPNAGGGGGGKGGTALIGPPGTPTATPSGSTQLDLVWTDAATAEGGYKIERSLDGLTGWTQVGTNAANDGTYSDTGLTAETTYYYRVRAYNGSRNGPYSAVFSGTTGAAEYAIAYQTNIVIEAYSDQYTFQDSALTTPATANDHPVGGWKTRTGTNHLIQATDGKRPLLKTNQVNGFPSVRFDGSDDFLQALFAQGEPAHLFLVAKHITWVADKALACAGSGNKFGSFAITATPGIGASNGSSTGGLNNNWAVGTWAILEFVIDSPSSIRVNNTAATTPGSMSGEQLGGFTLGARADSVNPSNIEVAAFLAYNANIGSTNRDTVVNALAARYGISL